MSNVLVTIITVSYNSESTIRKVIESVLNQTYQHIEYLVIDGNSSDQTVEIAYSYVNKFKEKGITYRVISEKDRGMYDALNKGVSLASGDIIGQINSDDWYENDAIESVVACFQKTKFDVFYANLRVITKSKIFIKKARFSWYKTSRYWNHPTTFIRSEVYKKNKYAEISMYDDFDLFLRLCRGNYKIVTLDKVLASFCFGGMSNKKNLNEVMKRCTLRWNNYRRNGYSFIYYFDGALTEIVKYMLS